MARHRTRSRRLSPYRLFLAVGLLFTALGTLVAHWGLNSSWFWSYLAAINLVTLCLYGFDKRQASDGKLRVPERVLHLHALIGGTPGALVAQRLFRHKTVKGSFRAWFWGLLVLQVILIAVWLYARQNGYL